VVGWVVDEFAEVDVRRSEGDVRVEGDSEVGGGGFVAEEEVGLRQRTVFGSWDNRGGESRPEEAVDWNGLELCWGHDLVV
jgi:hypothetical protein